MRTATYVAWLESQETDLIIALHESDLDPNVSDAACLAILDQLALVQAELMIASPVRQEEAFADANW